MHIQALLKKNTMHIAYAIHLIRTKETYNRI
jgi:hypothetical protein